MERKKTWGRRRIEPQGKAALAGYTIPFPSNLILAAARNFLVNGPRSRIAVRCDVGSLPYVLAAIRAARRETRSPALNTLAARS
jgi:hypothetical protein